MNDGIVEAEKVKTDVSRSDALAKLKDRTATGNGLLWTHQTVTEGRYKLMPQIGQVKQVTIDATEVSD